MRWADRLPAAPTVTLTTIVHIPILDGYWKDSLEVLEMCLSSFAQTTPEPFELVVLDNASCLEVREFLRQRLGDGTIDRLVLSNRNLGKVGAWNQLFAGSDGEWIGYCDSDVLALPGWFEASARVLEAFPKAAMVTAQPIPGDLSKHCDATLTGVFGDPAIRVEEGADLIEAKLVDSHRIGLGESPGQYAERLTHRRDVRVTKEGVSAYVSASHFQFLSRRDVLRPHFPLPTSVPLGDDPQFDDAIDSAGSWRLSTVDYLVHHLGNRRPDLESELPWLEGDRPPSPGASRTKATPAWRRRLAESPRLRRLLKAAHRQTFDLLYPE